MDMGITQVIPMSSQLCTHDTTPPHTHTHTEDHFFLTLVVSVHPHTVHMHVQKSSIQNHLHVNLVI